jgi:hypothetical protein
MKWPQQLLKFYTDLKPPESLPEGIDWLFPQKEEQVRKILGEFLDKYYDDHKKRTLILGINPGRFGAGVTGVNFTASKQLTENCGIAHPFKMQTELSAEFIYEMISAYGGPARFYEKYFIGSVCPLGFVKGGKNINYYDDKSLLKTVEPFIIDSIDRLMQMDFNKKRCICIGGEKNFKYLMKINSTKRWFTEIVTLPHPRFIMQYKRKEKPEYIDAYLKVLG